MHAPLWRRSKVTSFADGAGVFSNRVEARMRQCVQTRLCQTRNVRGDARRLSSRWFSRVNDFAFSVTIITIIENAIIGKLHPQAILGNLK